MTVERMRLAGSTKLSNSLSSVPVAFSFAATMASVRASPKHRQTHASVSVSYLDSQTSTQVCVADQTVLKLLSASNAISVDTYRLHVTCDVDRCKALKLHSGEVRCYHL